MAPPQGQMRPGRQLAALGLIFAVLYLMVFFAGASGSWQERLEPKLGLDLIGGTRVTLEATTEDGSPPPAASLDRARGIIENRVNSLGVSEAEVVTEGDRNIVVSLPGQNRDLNEIGNAAELRFRKVLKATDGGEPIQPQASPSPDASPAPDASPGAETPPDAEVDASPDAETSPEAGGEGGMAQPDPSDPATDPSPSPEASPAAAPDTEGPVELAAVQAKVGEAAWAAATGLQAPADFSADPTLSETLSPFGELTPAEVRVLPATVQYNVPYVTCDQLLLRQAGSIRDESQQVVACEGLIKYFLDEAKVLGTDVSDASGVMDQTTSQWVVSLNFTGPGQRAWTELTREAFNNTDQQCEASALGQDGKCRVAVVLDNEVISSPEIQGVLTGDSQITGDFTSATANELASNLRFGALPLTFEPQEAQSISATLGTEHLRAGLLAAGIGMLLVAVYSFFYYRMLGIVIFLSLILSALLVFGALVVLGRQIGFTLTLAGIAGLIVSLGVAADSFVLYFERLKDEIREGRSPRSAVPRAWLRARRTIISANAITLMAAVVLYIVSVGTVKGFAFALGLATVLDLVVVFLFRHPIMSMLARTKAFLSPRVSGLGRAVKTADDETPIRNPRVKEA
ncbi:protein translocase subunit SecD [Micromonospora sp. NBC_01813]|uniref:protein translocase subunit SecD n=1 Tax=Micromonospora sp. NBC_01813 TaxID=2975988 RepID=UPI002DD85726|nr:protein translocase subunit SecD [Micromonospora sp. NBC_01813]WSA11014.1 protein translocase subunit SecD [Micromonospora sp. NBC_01813]